MGKKLSLLAATMMTAFAALLVTHGGAQAAALLAVPEKAIFAVDPGSALPLVLARGGRGGGGGGFRGGGGGFRGGGGGFRGHSGFSGRSGFAGRSGFRGHRSVAGRSGFVGRSGFRGHRGFVGRSGFRGHRGFVGRGGFRGHRGFRHGFFSSRFHHGGIFYGHDSFGAPYYFYPYGYGRQFIDQGDACQERVVVRRGHGSKRRFVVRYVRVPCQQ